MEETYYGLIEDYLDGTLGEEERTIFEAKALADPELAKALDKLRMVRERLGHQFRQEKSTTELRKTLSILGEQHFNKPDPATSLTFRRYYMRWALVAAAFISLLIAVFFLRTGNNDLYKEYRKFPEAGFVTKGNNISELAGVDQAFNNGEYEIALNMLTAYLINNPADMEARFFAGLCAMELDRFSLAEASLKQILTTTNSWSKEARWYLALAYLKQKRTKECHELLSQIDSQESHFKEAQSLLKEL